MKISNSWINQSAMKRAEQQTLVRQNTTAEVSRDRTGGDDLKAGEALVLAQQVSLDIEQRDSLTYQAQSQVTTAGGDDAATKVTQHNQQLVIEQALNQVFEGQLAVFAVNGVGGGGPEVSGEASLTMNETVYHRHEQHASSSFTGTITTEDGRQIDFALHLALSHQQEWSYSQSVQIEKRQMTDPLVINFGRASAQLENTTFSFDLDADGSQDSIARLASGSGFLVFDRNGDGVANDGRELFGTQTGNGFSELAYHDQDGNQWIDENDPIFSQLSIMTVDANGEQQLQDLKSLGVGAIYLGSADGEVDLTNSHGMLVGQVKRSGMFLMEDGRVASDQELDLVKQSAEQELVSNPDTVMLGMGQFGMMEVLARGPAEESEPDEASTTEENVFSVDITDRMNQIRAQQKAYGDAIQEANQESEKSLLVQLLKQMEAIEADNRHKAGRAQAAYSRD
ncbi:MAG: hypothetical protein MI864_17820 [Pseudomonadales bacterium]|nr:hypothetical protein [Pseudomonadales bacterium]